MQFYFHGLKQLPQGQGEQNSQTHIDKHRLCTAARGIKPRGYGQLLRR